MKRKLEKALTNDKRPPVLEVARFLSCDVSTLCRYFPDLYQLVVVRYREAFLDKSARERVQREMQEIFAEGNETLPVSELTKRVGYSEDVLRSVFPDICKRYADRRRAELRKQHTTRMDKICDEICQVVFELHEKGIYPSANKVGRLMSYRCAILTKEGHDAWKSTLRELGY